jgi:hypothetical protein
MAKGIWELAPCSRGVGGVCDKELSAPKKLFGLPMPGGIDDVGDGSTSLSLEGGSLRSLFQIPVPHVKVPWWPRPMAEEALEWEPQGPALASAEGVVGCEVVGDMELLANEPFRGCGRVT